MASVEARAGQASFADEGAGPENAADPFLGLMRERQPWAARRAASHPLARTTKSVAIGDEATSKLRRQKGFNYTVETVAFVGTKTGRR